VSSIKTFATSAAFRASLEERLKQRYPGVAYQRGLRIFVFTRLLARLSQEFQSSLVLKGGMALELRLENRARTTKDLDLRFKGTPGELHQRLASAGRLDLGDYMTYRFEQPTRLENPGLVEGGWRFMTTAWLDGSALHAPFKVEIGIGDAMHRAAEFIDAPDLLSFIGVPPPRIAIYPMETHIAEKLHAYTFRNSAGDPSSRVKDLPDLGLLARSPHTSPELREAIVATFTHRATHEQPRVFPHPPEEWRPRYAKIARDAQLPWTDLDAAYAAVAAFLDPVLGAHAVTRWDPATWAWG